MGRDNEAPVNRYQAAMSMSSLGKSVKRQVQEVTNQGVEQQRVLQNFEKALPKSTFQKVSFQIKLLLWKRYLESTKVKWDLVKVITPAVSIFILLLLIYNVITDTFAPDGLEPFFVPFCFWVFMQRLLVHIMYEKSFRLQESMRMMGLSDFAYWVSYFISDGIILGFVLSLLCAILSTGGLFNGASIGLIFPFLYLFCLSAVPFCFFLSTFFDTPQTSGQVLVGILLGFYILYVVVFVVGTNSISLGTSQLICCLIPPLALQIGCGAFLKSYEGLPIYYFCVVLVSERTLFKCFPICFLYFHLS
jgi:hypothetical protein